MRGCIIRHVYLWWSEARKSREEGSKDRPCVIVHLRVNEHQELETWICPVTHAPPELPERAMEIPAATKKHLRLDDLALCANVLQQAHRGGGSGCGGVDEGRRLVSGHDPARSGRVPREVEIHRVARPHPQYSPRLPHLERNQPGRAHEVLIRRQQRQVVVNAKLCDQRVDRADLEATTPAGVAQLRGGNVIRPAGREQRKRREAIDDRFARFGSGKTLQQFLEDQAGHDDLIATLECVDESCYLGNGIGRVPPQRERPDTGIDEEAQGRKRSDL